MKKNRRPAISSISEITSELVSGYADYLRTTKIAVSTHNKKMRRLRKIFECLKDCCVCKLPKKIISDFYFDKRMHDWNGMIQIIEPATESILRESVITESKE